MLNGKELSKDVSLKDKITYITQNNFVFNDTIYNNIVLDSVLVEQELFWRAIEISEMNSLLEKLDMRECTKMGDCGKLFSGGEIQRVGIARALIKDNPIVIFDEPTSGLDVETSEIIINKLIKVFGNKILIFITHDKTVYSRCDYICQLNSDGINIQSNGD